MRSVLILFTCIIIPLSARSQTFTPDSLSLKTDTATLNSVCDCQDALFQYGTEQYSILLRVKKIGKTGTEAEFLNTEYIKRLDVHYRIYKKCFPIYQKDRYSVDDCPRYKEGEELDKKLSALGKELGMN